MLSLLLARAGVPVTLLEARKDCDRDFRGDTSHSSTLACSTTLVSRIRLDDLPHAKIRDLRLVSRAGTYAIAVFSRPAPKKSRLRHSHSGADASRSASRLKEAQPCS